MKKITIELSEVSNIVGSPDYGKVNVNFKPEGLNTSEIVVLLSSILQAQTNELLKEMDAMRSKIATLQSPLHRM